jgi:hypothetical protein
MEKRNLLSREAALTALLNDDLLIPEYYYQLGDLASI